MDNTIVIINDGVEKEMQILFTFEANDKKYVIVYDKENEDEVFAFTYDEDRNLFAVEDEKEMEMISEVLSAFEDGDEDEEEK